MIKFNRWPEEWIWTLPSLLYGVQVAPIFESYYWSRDQTPASTEVYEREGRMLPYFLQWPVRPSYWTATEFGSKSQWGILSPPARNLLKWGSFIKNGLLLQLNIGCCSNRVELLVFDNWWIISECVRCSEWRGATALEWGSQDTTFLRK